MATTQEYNPQTNEKLLNGGISELFKKEGLNDPTKSKTEITISKLTCLANNWSKLKPAYSLEAINTVANWFIPERPLSRFTNEECLAIYEIFKQLSKKTDKNAIIVAERFLRMDGNDSPNRYLDKLVKIQYNEPEKGKRELTMEEKSSLKAAIGRLKEILIISSTMELIYQEITSRNIQNNLIQARVKASENN